MPKSQTKVLVYGVFSILLGILLILVTLLLDATHKTPPVIIGLVDHLGIAFFSIGVIGLIVDLNDWRKYFQERIADTIIQKDFLKRLDKAELLQLQTDTLKVFFEADDIEREESLLDFLHTRIHGFIGTPYREDLKGIVSISRSPGEVGYTIEETVTYKCRKVGKFIQDKVQWFMQREADKDQILAFSIQVTIPNNFFQSPEFKTQYPRLSNAKWLFDANEKDERLKPSQVGLGYSLSLIDFKEIDGLLVEISVKYHICADRNIAWVMGCPTRGFGVTISYPEDLRLETAIFGVDQHECHPKDDPGLFFLDYDSWMLPTTGFVFHFSSVDASVQDTRANI